MVVDEWPGGEWHLSREGQYGVGRYHYRKTYEARGLVGGKARAAGFPGGKSVSLLSGAP